MRQQVQGEEEFPDEAQSRDCVKVVQQEVSYALDENNKRRPFQCMQGWKDELLQKHQIKGLRPPMMKGEDTKGSWCGWSYQVESIEAPNIENKMEDCEECTATLSFYAISGSDLFYSPHGGRES